MFGELFSIVAPVYVAAALGYGWVRSGRRYDSELVTDLIMTIGAPCLVFSSLATMSISYDSVLQIAGATFAALLCFLALGAVFLRIVGLPWQTFLSPMVFVNSGNMGLPLCLFAFGEVGVALGAVYFAVTSIVHFTLGLAIWSGEWSLGALARTPLVWACIAATLALTFEWSVPLWLERTTELLGGFAIPLMQLSLGASLGRLQLAHVPRTLMLSVARLAIGLGVGFGLAELLALEGVVRGVFVLDCAMPAAVINALFAERYQRAPAEVASIVVMTTLLSFALTPLLLPVLLP